MDDDWGPILKETNLSCYRGDSKGTKGQIFGPMMEIQTIIIYQCVKGKSPRIEKNKKQKHIQFKHV